MANTSKTQKNPTASKVTDPLKVVGALNESQTALCDAFVGRLASNANLSPEEYAKLDSEYSGDKSFVLEYGQEYKVLVTDIDNVTSTCKVRDNICEYVNLEGGKRLSLRRFSERPEISNFKASDKVGYLKVLPTIDAANMYAPIEKAKAAVKGMLYVSYAGKCERFDAANNIKLQDGRLYLFSIHK